MKRSIRVRVDLVVDVDDDGSGIPHVFFEPTPILSSVAKLLVPGAVYLHPGGLLEIRLTRDSLIEVRRAERAKSMRRAGGESTAASPLTSVESTSSSGAEL